MSTLQILPLVLFALHLSGVLPGADIPPPGKELAQPGIHCSGRWAFDLSVIHAGTRSQGQRGLLSFDGVMLPFPPKAGDAYQTPWGLIGWIGPVPPVPWVFHGWQPVAAAATILPDPADHATIRIRLRRISRQPPPADAAAPETWISQAMHLYGQEPFSVEAWRDLDFNPVTLHDSKHFGQAALQLQPPARTDAAIRLTLSGVPDGELSLPRRLGAHLVVHRILSGRFGDLDILLALEAVPELHLPPEAIGADQTLSEWERLLPEGVVTITAAGGPAPAAPSGR